jgi:hypothetical protein
VEQAMRRLGVVLAAVVLATAGFAVMVPAGAVEESVEFDGRGDYEFEVPQGVCSLFIRLTGASGGDGVDGAGAGVGTGGGGGNVQATIAVVPGETLDITLGAFGQDGDNNSVEDQIADGGPGGSGVGEGGDGGNVTSDSAAGGGGGGGGASIILRGTTIVAVAGGGGGGGGGQTGDAGAGGDGDLDPTDGTNGDPGGTGGTGGASGVPDGDDAAAIDTTPQNGGGGGGGGGGLLGGAEGVGGAPNGGGGGGGSSFLIAGALDPFFATDQTGDGEVRFTFDTAAGTCPAVALESEQLGFVG